MQMKPGVETLCFSLSGEFGELRAEWVNAALLPWYQSEEMKILSNNFYYSRVAIEPPTVIVTRLFPCTTTVSIYVNCNR